MPTDTWSASQYLKFEDERTRPARDLLAAVPLASAAAAVDIGCGPGNSTELIAARYPGARLTGLDSSPDMLAAALQRLPQADFIEADVATWTPPAPVDLMFANAVFQWVPDHLAVVDRLIRSLTHGGVIAFQVPDNLGEPSHVLMREVAARGYFAAKFRTPMARDEIPSVETYYDRLRPHAARVEIWRTIYHHALADADAIVEWVKATGLRPFLDRLTTDERPDFLSEYREALQEAYPRRTDGRVLFRFPRLFVIAVGQ
jgi:trans-aconitate 2-methyltransferase